VLTILHFQDLDVVVYPGRSAGNFEVKLSQLRPGARYAGQGGQRFTADASGNAAVFVHLDGRTAINFQPVN